eukprot:scaffold102654_cov24-Tisochrysis_lutea.AAC.2
MKLCSARTMATSLSTSPWDCSSERTVSNDDSIAAPWARRPATSLAVDCISPESEATRVAVDDLSSPIVDSSLSVTNLSSDLSAPTAERSPSMPARHS